MAEPGMAPADHAFFALGDFALESGVVLPGARLAYTTYGTLSPTKDNVILMTGGFNASVAEHASRIGGASPLDPARWFIIVIPLIGNGQSSSPSNTPPPFDGPRFPPVSIADNVRAQHRLVTERFGIERLALVTGFSMGALQAYHWAAHYPEMVARIAPICGAARCSRHNYVFLAGLAAALKADARFNGGDTTEKPVAGLAAFGRVFAGWAFSQAFYRAEIDRRVMGFASSDDYLATYWDTLFQACDPNDLLAMVWTWQHADISANAVFNGDFGAALAAITARAVVMPGETDLYFPVADNEAEVALMRDARCAPIPSLWGHIAGAPGANAADEAFINARIADLLAG